MPPSQLVEIGSAVLEQVVKILTDEDGNPKVKLAHPDNGKASEPPKTVPEAVDRLVAGLPLKDKATIASLTEDELVTLQFTLGSHIGKEFGIWSGNRNLLESCEHISGDPHMHPDFAPTIIINELWKRLKETHKLRVIK